jgi:signal transduction histidine kinase
VLSRAGLRRPSRAALLDLALALVFLVIAQVDVWAPQLADLGDGADEGIRPLNAVLLAAVALSLAWRRRAPLAAVAVLSAAAAVQALLPGAAPIGLLLAGPVLIGLYSVAAYGSRRASWAGLVVVAAAVAVHDLTDPVLRADLEGTSWWWLVLLVGWLVGRYVGSRRAAADLERRARVLEEERRQAETAVQEERARIARELHDVVAHSVSVVAVQAGAAQAVLGSDPDRAREPLGAIETTARNALVEMRRLLGVLRAAEEEPTLAPQPGLADLPAVAASVTAAGLPVELVVEGEPAPLPAGLELAAHRIVQEALTNALRHARASRARVTVRHRPQALEVTVADDGGGGPTGRPGGHGIVGMRERVALYGGELSVGPGETGGYVVRAVLPRDGGA